MTFPLPDPSTEPSHPEGLFSPSLPGLQIAWDSTSLGLLKECPRKYYYTIILGWQPTGFAAHLAFGIALHKALETYDKAKALSGDYDRAVEEAVGFCLHYGHRTVAGEWAPYDAKFTHEPSKTRETLLRAVVWYLDQYREDPFQTLILSDGSPAVELSFKVNLKLTTPEGDPFLLCGHLDRVGRVGPHLYWMDRKTTKSDPNSRYWATFTPNNQMSLYHAATQLIFPETVSGGIIDAIQLGATFARFRRHTITRTPGQQAEWEQDTYQWIGLATHFAAENHWPQNDKACGNFGGCPFQIVCSRDPKVRKLVLENEGFIHRQWNPLISR